MIANVTPHRRANAFAQALEDRTPSDLSEPDPAAEQSEAPAEPADHDRLLALASVLGEECRARCWIPRSKWCNEPSSLQPWRPW